MFFLQFTLYVFYIILIAIIFQGEKLIFSMINIVFIWRNLGTNSAVHTSTAKLSALDTFLKITRHLTALLTTDGLKHLQNCFAELGPELIEWALNGYALSYIRRF